MTVGARVRPIDWEDITLGRRKYTGDLPELDGLLHVEVVRAPYPAAGILSVDVMSALEMDGVRGVLTPGDFPPGIIYRHRGEPFSDWPPLADGVTRYVGQEVAALAADSKPHAVLGARAITVRYRRTRAIETIAEALPPLAPDMHKRSEERNVASRWDVGWGKYAAGREAGTVAVSGSYWYPSTVHACMEPNIVLARWDADRELMELWTSTQAPYFIVKEVAHILGLEQSQVVCREVAVGGGFGSKSKISTHEVIAAALSRKTGRPTLLQFSRDEEFAVNKTRHQFNTTLETGADSEGQIRYLDGRILANNGAYCHMGPSVLKVGAITLGSMYRPDGVKVDARLVDTNQLPGGPFRGYGAPQVSLAMESQVDELAAAFATDPIDFRLKNLRPAYETTHCGYEVGSSGLEQCLIAVRRESDWDLVRRYRRDGVGIGVAAGMHGSGSYAYEHSNRADAAIDVREDGSVRVRFGGADAGTGQRTILAQIAAEELGVPLSCVTVLSMDSEDTPFEMGAWSSRGTHMTGHAVRLAAKATAEALREVRDRLVTASTAGTTPAALEPVDIGVLVKNHPATCDGTLTIEASHQDPHTKMMAPGRDRANLSPSYAFAAHAATVHVDRRTGRVRVLD